VITWRSGEVETLGRRWRGALELRVLVADRTVRALAYPALVGEPQPGDRVLLNTGALAQDLGTGGYALVVAIPDRLPPDSARPGHIVKARYTPLQVITMAADEEVSPHRDLLMAADSLDGMPVVLADLHSALPAVLAGVRSVRPDARVAYVMTDGGALPAWFSRTLSDLEGHLAGVVTTGQAFGGDLEAVTVHSGLLAARHVLRAEVTVVSQGPGNLGTGMPWSYSGVTVGEAVNAVAVLGGRPVGSLRLSGADARSRHFGLSHHSVTAYAKVALSPADLVVPAGLDEPLRSSVAAALEPLRARHQVIEVATDGLDDALRASPVKLSTMGRDLDGDYPYFLAAAAAGKHAATLLNSQW
jgi:Protein of unknown function (DUF3866)